MSVNYSFQDHLINRQAEAEAQMLKRFEEGNYTIANPLVVYNAYLVNPLSAVICFETEEETAVTLTVLGKTVQGNISHTFPKAKKHVLLVCILSIRTRLRSVHTAERRTLSRLMFQMYLTARKLFFRWIRLQSIYRTTSFWYLRQVRIWQLVLTMQAMQDGI